MLSKFNCSPVLNTPSENKDFWVSSLMLFNCFKAFSIFSILAIILSSISKALVSFSLRLSKFTLFVALSKLSTTFWTLSKALSFIKSSSSPNVSLYSCFISLKFFIKRSYAINKSLEIFKSKSFKSSNDK